MIFDRLLLAAMVVGVIAGVVYTSVQLVQVIPIIQIAERFESNPGSTVQEINANAHAHHNEEADGHADDSGGWAPADGLERTTFTLLTNTLTAIGLAVVLVSLMVWTRGKSGLENLTWWQGVLWGLAGYLAFFAAPSFGLPPELPGSAAAPLEDRQIWWVATVAMTTLALLAVAFLKSPWRWLALLIAVVPHVLGAPSLELGDPLFPTQEPAAAAELMILTGKFVSATAIANGVLWIVLGLTSVWAIHRFIAPIDNQSTAQ